MAGEMLNLMVERYFTMSTTLLIILIGLVVIAAIVAWAFLQKRRTTTLRSRFGPEYEHAVREYGTRTSAERALEKRAERIEKYRIRPLNEQEHDRFVEEWRRTQSHFVDDPPLAIREADHLVAEVMSLRGYPMADFERRAEDLSVDHPNVIRNYRAAHGLAVSQEEGRANTEDLRKAMVHYRELFDELLEAQPSGFRERR
jgi:cell division protein FtsL